MSISFRQTAIAARLACFTVILLMASAGSSVFAAEDQEQQLKQYQDDCRLEGEASGLTGSHLDEYIQQCVEELADVEMTNIHSDK
ncbi:hypothetical protein [Thiosocius teredinicola]|uniref:hypothetical protein n=1 Tax=Thiosocius teredinicola TaxID=1973002 RepID=UPI000F7734F9